MQLPNYYIILGADLDYTIIPAEILAYLILSALTDYQPDVAPPMHGTQDSFYDAGNPAIAP